MAVRPLEFLTGGDYRTAYVWDRGKGAMAAVCAVCGAKLGIGRRLTGKTLCDQHQGEDDARRAAEAASRAEARDEYLVVAASTASDPGAMQRLPAIAARAGLTDAERISTNSQALAGVLAAAIEDEYLTEEEEAAINRAMVALQVPEAEVLEVVERFGNGLLIARLNAGRLPEIPDPVIFLKPKEVAHVQVDAELMKEVVHRETRGGFSGFSIPIAMGVRYRVGAYRGQSVVVGTSLVVADRGVLCLTSQRAVFKGIRQSVECLYPRLVGVNVFDDGIQFHVSNRKNATLLRVADGHLVAAAVNTAMHPQQVSK